MIESNMKTLIKSFSRTSLQVHRSGLAMTCMAILCSAFLASCSSQYPGGPLTRTETDYYTITIRDSTSRETVANVPGSKNDNGVVFPSSRTTDIERHTLSFDSTHDRNYPNFLRAGGIETAGLIGSSSSNGLGPGLFGIYSLFSGSTYQGQGTLLSPPGPTNQNTNGNQLIKGELLRIAPMEFRLRWFDDAPNWTIGWSAYELLAPDENRNNWLSSIGTNVYLRRRIYLRDQIPYIIFSPYLGGSLLPSMYANLGGELQVGSLAGMNVRAYAGFADGFTWGGDGNFHHFPYFGLGTSVLDFTNKVAETEKEWKDYVYTGINVNILEVSLYVTSQKYTSLWSNGTLPFPAMQMKLATAEIPLPFGNYHFWAGTSLLNYMGMGFYNQGLGIFPLRVGYRQNIFGQDLMLEPFFEFNYYPSTMLNIGVRLKIDTRTGNSLGITAGYATGSEGDFAPQVFNSDAPPASLSTSFSTAYVGISFFFGDWNKSPETVRALRALDQ
jgi:hypothetical protein